MLARRVMRRMPTDDGHHGLLARVYDDSIVFERRDFEDMGILGEDWILPLGGAGAVRRCTTAPPLSFYAAFENAARIIPAQFDGDSYRLSLDGLREINRAEAVLFALADNADIAP